MAFPCKIMNPFINLDLHDGLFVIFSPPFVLPGKAMHTGAGCFVTARMIGQNKENNRTILADGLEVVSLGHCTEKLILPHLNLFIFTPININFLIPLILFGSESKCQFASMTVKGPDGPIAVTPLLFVGFNQSCADPCCMPTSTVINWGTVNIGFTMADFWAGVVNIAFEALIEIAIDQSFNLIGKMIPKGLKKQQAIMSRKLIEYGSAQFKKMRKQLDILGKKFGKSYKDGLNVSDKMKSRITKWVKQSSESLSSKKISIIKNKKMLLEKGTKSIKKSVYLVKKGSYILNKSLKRNMKKSVSAVKKGFKSIKEFVFNKQQKQIKKTGAYLKGVQGSGKRFGKLTGKSIKISEKTLETVKKHIKKFGDDKPNEYMLIRLQNALEKGEKISGADAVFFTHELVESHMMLKGLSYEEAHQKALQIFGVSPFSVYHPDVIKQFKDHFNKKWFNFWEIN